MVGSQHTIMYVALEAESNTISPSEMNRSESTSLNFYAICRAQPIRITPTLLATLAADGFEITRGLLIRRAVLEYVPEQTNLFSYFFNRRKTLGYIQNILDIYANRCLNFDTYEWLNVKDAKVAIFLYSRSSRSCQINCMELERIKSIKNCR